MSATKQRIVLAWSLIFMSICAIAFGALCRMIPPPDANQTSLQVAHWYQQHHTTIRIGAMIAGWTSAFMIPFAVVIAEQVERIEEGRKIWSKLALTSGALTAVFFALPPIAWGAAAFFPQRSPDVTAVMHQFGTLTYITTDQLYLFMWVTVAVVCFLPQKAPHSPFPRWWGYATAWIIIMFEAGAVAFIPHTGPFRWNGILAFWFPLFLFGGWMFGQGYLIWRALKLQQQAEQGSSETARPAPIGAAAPVGA
jgi:hypothetical protein